MSSCAADCGGSGLVALPEGAGSDFASPEVFKLGTGVAAGVFETAVVAYRDRSDGVLVRAESVAGKVATELFDTSRSPIGDSEGRFEYRGVGGV